MKIPQQNHHLMQKLFLTNLGIKSWRLTYTELKKKKLLVLQVQLTSILLWIYLDSFRAGIPNLLVVPGTSFMEEKFSTDQVRGAGEASG